MTLRRALSVTTTVAATVPIDPPRAIPPGSFPTGEAFSPLGSGHTHAEASSVTFPISLGCACCVARRKRAPHIGPEPRAAGGPPKDVRVIISEDVLPRLVTFPGACGSRCRSGFHRGQRSSWTNNHGFLEMFESSRASSTPLPIRRSTLRRLLSAAKFRVGSGVTY